MSGEIRKWVQWKNVARAQVLDGALKSSRGFTAWHATDAYDPIEGWDHRQGPQTLCRRRLPDISVVIVNTRNNPPPERRLTHQERRRSRWFRPVEVKVCPQAPISGQPLRGGNMYERVNAAIVAVVVFFDRRLNEAHDRGDAIAFLWWLCAAGAALLLGALAVLMPLNAVLGLVVGHLAA